MIRTFLLASLMAVGLCLPGGFNEVTDPAQVQSAKDLLNGLQTNGMLTLDSSCTIQKIEKQIVAGENIRYTMSCSGHTCHLVVFNQVWTSTLKVTENQCVHKRQLGMVGGYFTQTNATDIQNYIDKLAGLVSAGSLTLEQYRVTKVETQVVAGVNIRYTLQIGDNTCTIVVWEQSWTNMQQITTNTCSKTRRQLGGGVLLGGWSNIDKDVPEVQQCISKALDSINGMSNSLFRMVDSHVITAKQQVVAGMNYAVTFQTQQSTCMNNQAMFGKTSADCPVDANSMMAQSTWKAQCYKHLDGTFDLSDVSLNKENEAAPQKPDVPVKDNVLKTVNSGLVQVKNTVDEVITPAIQKGKSRVFGAVGKFETPNVSILRKKRDVNFLIDRLNQKFGQNGADWIEQGKQLLGGGDDQDLVNHVKDMIGQDGHDLINHGQKMLGGDGHDLVDHVLKKFGGDLNVADAGTKVVPVVNLVDINKIKQVLEGDGHDLVDHGKKLLGGDGHDLVDHGMKLLGGDGHDLVDHGMKLLGGDGHDLVDHGMKLLGGDGHDLVDHGMKLLGGDGHDLVDRGKKLLGGDGHDLVDHGKQVLGGDVHDLVDHGKKLLGGDDHDLKFHTNQNKSIIGGDDHDYCHKGMFVEFKQKFGKLYGTNKEEEKRYVTFCDNMRIARKLQETEQGTAKYGATKFADLTKEEFKQYVGKKWDVTANQWMKKADIPKGSIPDSFDWRDHGAVTPVKNQGSCGSCWAFSTTGNIEGQWAIKRKTLLSLSEQELVDCDKVDEGCNGGLPSQAYKEIERLGGLETEADYAYKGEDENCQFKKSAVKVYINDSVSISSDENEMASWLVANGPISIGINAMAMQFYMGGISHPWKIFCNPKDLDHGVLIVGYGVEGSKPYWIVKNSWGENWGEKGYYLVYRGAGVCGLNTMCTSAVVD